MTRPTASPGRHHNDSLGGRYGHVKPFIPGGYLCSQWRDQRPVPPISEYEAYRDTVDARARKHVDPIKYRRITIMVRNATPPTEAARLVGYAALPRSYKKMPEHLK